MVWSLALWCPDDARQDPVVNGAEFGVVFPAEGPRTVPIQEGLDCLGLYHSGLEGERYFGLVVELTWIPPDAHPVRRSAWRFQRTWPGFRSRRPLSR